MVNESFYINVFKLGDRLYPGCGVHRTLAEAAKEAEPYLRCYQYTAGPRGLCNMSGWLSAPAQAEYQKIKAERGGK